MPATTAFVFRTLGGASLLAAVMAAHQFNSGMVLAEDAVRPNLAFSPLAKSVIEDRICVKPEERRDVSGAEFYLRTVGFSCFAGDANSQPKWQEFDKSGLAHQVVPAVLATEASVSKLSGLLAGVLSVAFGGLALGALARGRAVERPLRTGPN